VCRGLKSLRITGLFEINKKKFKLKKVSDKIGQNENCNFISNPYEFEINQNQNWVFSEKLSSLFSCPLVIECGTLKNLTQKIRIISA
jgi:hypothetical protein